MSRGLRIIAGEFGGRVLKLPQEAVLRPTSERVREAIFSTLQALVPMAGASVLDLYAGSGALGIEALSRGAAYAVFVEANKAAAENLAENLGRLGIGSRAAVLAVPVARAWPQLTKQAEKHPFDLVFADPPYAEHPGRNLLVELESAAVLGAESLIVIEGRRGLFDVNGEFGTVEMLKERTYGDTQVSYFRLRNL